MMTLTNQDGTDLVYIDLEAEVRQSGITSQETDATSKRARQPSQAAEAASHGAIQGLRRLVSVPGPRESVSRNGESPRVTAARS